MRTGRLKQIPIQDSFIASKIRAKEGKIKKMRKVFKKKIRADANEQKKFKKHPKKVREASSVIDEDIEDLLKEYGESSDELIVNLYPRKKQPLAEIRTWHKEEKETGSAMYETKK